MKLLLDTSILIDVLRLRNRRREWLAELVRGGHTLSTTTLNIAEIYAGMRPSEEGRTEALLGGLELYELSEPSARLATFQFRNFSFTRCRDVKGEETARPTRSWQVATSGSV